MRKPIGLFTVQCLVLCLLLVGSSLAIAGKARQARLPATAMPDGFGVTVSIDKPEYFSNISPENFEPPIVHMSLRVFNNSDQPVTMEFASGQQFDFEILDSEGNLIWRWSDGKVFIQILSLLTLVPGESKIFKASHPLADSLGEPLPEGLFTVTGKLAAPGRTIEGTTTFMHTHLP